MFVLSSIEKMLILILMLYLEWPLFKIGAVAYCQAGIQFTILNSCFFSLQVPQHYKLMGYQPVSVWDALNSYFPPTLARPLLDPPSVTKHLILHNRSKSTHSLIMSLTNPFTFIGWASVLWGPVSTNSAPKSPGGGSCQFPPHCCRFKPTRNLCEASFHTGLCYCCVVCLISYSTSFLWAPTPALQSTNVNQDSDNVAPLCSKPRLQCTFGSYRFISIFYWLFSHFDKRFLFFS